MGFRAEAETYAIVGLYRQSNAWQNRDDPYGTTPNTILVPKGAITGEPLTGKSGICYTLVLHNGKMEEFQKLQADDGYPNLFPLLTVQENIQYPLTLKKMPKKEAVPLGRAVRQRLELSERYDNRLPSHLSGGEQQRVAIARTLAQGCGILLADEPTGNLDSANTRNIVEILRSLAHEDGCTVIIVTHAPAAAEQADAVLRMKDGRWID